MTTAHAVCFRAPDGSSRQLVIPSGLSPTAVTRRVRDAFHTGQSIELRRCGRPLRQPWDVTGDVDVVPVPMPPPFQERIFSAVNKTRLGLVLKSAPQIELEARILVPFRRQFCTTRSMLTLTIDLDSGDVDIIARPVESMIRAQDSDDPAFDRAALQMFHGFDAKRVVPVFIVCMNPYSACLFLNALPWAEDARFCCESCGSMSCVCGD